MKVRPWLLIGSLIVSAVASVAIGFIIARSQNDADSPVVLDPTLTIAQPGGIPTNDLVEGTPLPNATIQTLAGDDVPTSELLGNPMVINVWGSTCGPCKKELPDFAKVHAVYGDQVRFVGIDYLPPSEREENFARDRGVQYELLYDATGDFINTMGISAFPVTLIVTADGTIVQQTGQLDEAKLNTLIQENLL